MHVFNVFILMIVSIFRYNLFSLKSVCIFIFFLVFVFVVFAISVYTILLIIPYKSIFQNMCLIPHLIFNSILGGVLIYFINQILPLFKEENENFDTNILNIPIYGMVKDDKHSTRALMNKEREELPLSNILFNLITMFQDSVHDTAIGYHKKLREKELTKSALDEIKGIGDVKKNALLKKFGSIKKIAEADVEEICKVKGINEELAK